jgi:hypothetical protein
MANGYPNGGGEYEDEGWWEDIYTDPETVPDPIPEEAWVGGDQTPQTPLPDYPDDIAYPTPQPDYPPPEQSPIPDYPPPEQSPIPDYPPPPPTGPAYLQPPDQNWDQFLGNQGLTRNQVTDQGQPAGLQELFTAAGADDFDPTDLPWVDAPAGMEAWWRAGEPRNLDFTWQNQNWWPDPENWGDHINRIRSTGEGVRRWEDMPTYQDIPSSAYTWEKTGRTEEDFPIENIGDWRNLQTRYGSEMGFDDESPWGPGQALYKGANIGHHQTEFNQNMENFRLASEMAHQDWLNRDTGGDPNALRDACLAKGDGSTWDGTSCVPPEKPGEDLGAACRAKGWNWDGNACTPPTQPTIPVGEQDCINNNGTWTGTACDYRYTPGYDPTTGTPIDTTLPRFNDDPTDARFTPTNTLPPDWLNALYPHQDEIPFLPQEFEDMTRVDVGADPLSQMTNKILANLGTTGGVAYTPLAGAVENRLISTLENEGQGPLSPLQAQILNNLGDVITNRGEIYDPQREAMEIESIRSPLDTLRQSQLAEGQAAMAGRGMLGSGPEADYMQRLERSLAPQYTTAAQRLEIDRRNRRDDRLEKAMELGARTESERETLRTNRLNTALSEATGMSEEQSRNLLNTAKTVTDRQQMLNDIAIASLDRNMEWNKFLAEHQLKRHEIIEAIQADRFNAILPLIQAYMTGASITATGFTKPTDDTSKRTTGDK